MYWTPPFVETPLRPTERHLPYGIICCLPPDTCRWTRPALTTARQLGTRFAYNWRVEGWVDLKVDLELSFLCGTTHSRSICTKSASQVTRRIRRVIKFSEWQNDK